MSDFKYRRIGEVFWVPDDTDEQFCTRSQRAAVPELKGLFATASYIARPGQINAWGNLLSNHLPAYRTLITSYNTPTQ